MKLEVDMLELANVSFHFGALRWWGSCSDHSADLIIRFFQLFKQNSSRVSFTRVQMKRRL